MYFLDTNAVVHFLKRNRPQLVLNVKQALDEGAQLFIAPVVLLELEVGVIRSSSPESAREALEKFLSLISAVPPFERRDAELAAHIRAGLMRQGQIIGAFDLLIAAQAIRSEATIVTNNVREFSRIPGLAWEDWTLP